jgi:Na+/H+-translocating membrane pyrophosphatase
MVFATVIAGAIAFAFTKFIPLMATDNSLVITIPKFLLISALAIIAYLIASFFLELDEVQPIVDYLKKKLFKNIK